LKLQQADRTETKIIRGRTNEIEIFGTCRKSIK